MIEYEKKILLTADEYMAIILWNSKFLQEPICQINHYYDTENLDMNKQGITCRIREIDGKYTATVKKHKTNVSECSIEESKVAVSSIDDSFFADLNVKLYGSMKTERIIINDEPEIKIMLDKNTYLDTVDYEIEIEYSPKEIVRAHKAVQDFCEILDAVYKNFNFIEFYSRTKNPKSKSERFFEVFLKSAKEKEGKNK